MKQLILYCRAGFEKECAAEIQDKAGQHGVFGYCKLKGDSAFVIFEAYDSELLATFYRDYPFEQLGVIKHKAALNYWLLAQAAAGMALILFFKAALAPMLTFAMTLAFLTTPVFAWLNYSLMRGDGAIVLSKPLKLLSWLGLAYLIGFALLFLLWFAKVL